MTLLGSGGDVADPTSVPSPDLVLLDHVTADEGAALSHAEPPGVDDVDVAVLAGQVRGGVDGQRGVTRAVDPDDDMRRPGRVGGGPVGVNDDDRALGVHRRGGGGGAERGIRPLVSAVASEHDQGGRLGGLDEAAGGLALGAHGAHLEARNGVACGLGGQACRDIGVGVGDRGGLIDPCSEGQVVGVGLLDRHDHQTGLATASLRGRPQQRGMRAVVAIHADHDSIGERLDSGLFLRHAAIIRLSVI